MRNGSENGQHGEMGCIPIDVKAWITVGGDGPSLQKSQSDQDDLPANRDKIKHLSL
jgi:hypothetical protein